MEPGITIIGKGVVNAIIEAQAEFAVVGKASDNPFYDSKYADLPSIMRMVGPILAAHGLAVSQHPGVGGSADEPVDTLTTYILHTSGEVFQSTMRLHLLPDKNGKITPQAQGSAITYARRYALSAVLGIVTDVDDDGNQASQTNGAQPTITLVQRETLRKAATEAHLTPATAQDILEAAVGVRNSADVPTDRFEDALDALRASGAMAVPS